MILASNGTGVLGCGMTTAVGYTAAETCAAVRAKISGATRSEFMALGGTLVACAQVPFPKPTPTGLLRHALLLEDPLRECLACLGETPVGQVPLLIGLPEIGRVDRPPGLDAGLLPLLEELLQVRFHPDSKTIPAGRVAGGIGLLEATRMLADNLCEFAIVAGVDSYVSAPAVYHYDDRFRILSERNSDGFIPGEAGTAVLVGSHPGPGTLRVRSVGLGVEAATIGGDLALRGDGLTAAYRQALEDTGLGLHDVKYRMASCSGEAYWFKEAALALGRVTRVRREFQDFWHPAECIGEAGAAAVPAMLAIAFMAAAKGYAPGESCMIHASNDDDKRIALLVDRVGGAAHVRSTGAG